MHWLISVNIDTVDLEIIEEDLSYEIGMGNVNSNNYDNTLNNEVNNNDNNIIDTVADVEMIEENLDFETEIGNDKNYNDLKIGTSAYKKKLKSNKQKINSELWIKGKDYKTRKGTLVKKKNQFYQTPASQKNAKTLAVSSVKKIDKMFLILITN